MTRKDLPLEGTQYCFLLPCIPSHNLSFMGNYLIQTKSKLLSQFRKFLILILCLKTKEWFVVSK